MFSFIKKYTETMEHSTIYPIFSLLVFVVFFIGVLWNVKVMDQQEVDTKKNLPLEN